MTGRVELSASTWRQPWPPPVNPRRTAAVEQIAARIQAIDLPRVRVAIDGRSAAGKTTLGHELAWVLAGNGLVVLRASLDDFKRPWSERHLYDRISGEGFYRNAHDFDAIRMLLLGPAAPTGSGRVTLCSIDPLTQHSHAHEQVTMPEGAILIVDTTFAFRPELVDYWDLRIWVHVAAETSVQRGIERDGARDGFAAAEAVHRDRYAVAMDVYLNEVDAVALAHIVVDNTDFEEPRIVRD